MGLMLALLNLICFLIIPVKSGEPAKEKQNPFAVVKSMVITQGKIAHLQSEFPVSSYKFASSGIDNSLNSCSCANTTCSCCAHVVVPHIVDEEACINVSYVSADLGFRLQLILGGRVIYSGEISVRNPPPICIGIPYLKKYAKICLDLYNITWKKHIGGCAKIQVRLLFVIRKDFDLGCFNFDDLDDESKRAASRILLELKMYQMMVDAMKHQRQNKGPLVI